MRFALIERGATLETVRAYLPSNYSAVGLRTGGVVVYGADSCGWTLDDYVIPRLASGLIFAREIDIASAEEINARLAFSLRALA